MSNGEYVERGQDNASRRGLGKHTTWIMTPFTAQMNANPLQNYQMKKNSYSSFLLISYKKLSNP